MEPPTSSCIPAINGETLSVRDCFVPPGALDILLLSTDQGPIVHSVKETSRLRHHVTEGDHVLAVDDVDTANRRAEDVMQLLMARRGHRRKITIASNNNNIHGIARVEPSSLL